MTRRQVLRAAIGGGLVLGAGKAVDNVFIGYGELVGTNLVAQADSGVLASLANVGLGAPDGTRLSASGYSITIHEDTVHVHADETRIAHQPLAELRAAWAADLGLPAPLARLAADLGAIARDEHAFEFYRMDAFFDRVTNASTRPETVEALRQWPTTDPQNVRAFTDVDPAEPQAVLTGLVDGFRNHSYYDAPRYVAGSIQDNVIFGAVDLRAPLRQPVDFEALADDGKLGLFCYEFTHRSLEALQSVPATEQAPPVAAARVLDTRHKHVYTAVASVVRDGDSLAVPMTFVDYTHTTLYDDLRLRSLLGEGLEAYDKRHRATAIDWNPYG